MRIPHIVVAVLTAAALFALAPAARADGFFVTFTARAGGTSTQRLAGAVFDSSTGNGQNTGHVEIDDWLSGTELFRDTVMNQSLNVVVDFTGADGKVYLETTFSDAFVTRWTIAFNPGGSPRLSQMIDFSFRGVNDKTVTGSGANVARPRVSRVAGAGGMASIDDAYLQVPSFSGESTKRPQWTQLTSFTLSVPVSTQRKPQPGSVVVTKAMGANTPKFQAALANRTDLGGVKFVFVKRAPDGSESTRLTITLSRALVTSDALQAAASGQTESVAFSYQKIELQETTQDLATAGATKASYDLVQSKPE
jgi:type VI protein secretion system component Hcp